MARLDTGWHANPKVLQTGLTGMGLHAWSISYCDHARSDGFIPAGAWPAMPGVGAAVKALLVMGLWERAEGGFRLHDFDQYNRSRAQIEAEQEDARERQSRHRSRVTNGVTNSEHSRAPATPARTGDRAPGPGPGVTYSDTRDPLNPLTPSAGAQGAPPTAPAHAEPERTPPKWQEVAPGQFKGDPNGVGDVSLLKVRCPRCERSMPVALFDEHPCELIVGAPVETPNYSRSRRRRRLPDDHAEPTPDFIYAELERMKTERPTAEQIAAELERHRDT